MKREDLVRLKPVIEAIENNFMFQFKTKDCVYATSLNGDISAKTIEMFVNNELDLNVITNRGGL